MLSFRFPGGYATLGDILGALQEFAAQVRPVLKPQEKPEPAEAAPLDLRTRIEVPGTEPQGGRMSRPNELVSAEDIRAVMRTPNCPSPPARSGPTSLSPRIRRTTALWPLTWASVPPPSPGTWAACASVG
ncbi:hypothetical protein GCM10010233_61540 [Streptomyces pseudogriseolus]|nr:hypothetical protein GCM10010233_61540 [Streptomyces gancidicus]